MKHIKLFENFNSVNEEFETSEIKSVAKKIYLDLKSKGEKVTLEYQDEKLGAAGKSKQIGEKEISSDIVKVSYHVKYLMVSPIKSEEEANEILKKYSSDKVKGEVSYHKMDFEWAKDHPGWWIVNLKLVEQNQRSSYNLNKGYYKPENKNDRKRKE